MFKLWTLRFQPPLGGLGTTYDVRLWLIGLSVNRTFSLGVTADTLRAIFGSKSAILLKQRPVDPKFQVEGVAPTNHSFSQKTSLNDLSYDIKMWTDFSSVLSHYTRLTD